MLIIYQSLVIAFLAIIAVCCIVFPILFLVSFHSFRKDIHELVLLKQKEGDHREI